MSIQKRYVPYVVKGNNNQIVVVVDGQERELSADEGINGLDIKIEGENNFIRIEMPLKCIESRVVISGNSNRLAIKSSRYKIIDALFVIQDGGSIDIGKDVYLNGDFKAFVTGKKGLCLNIGSEFGAASGCVIRCSDGHVIYDATHKTVLNDAKGITIGNHVWVGTRCLILKNACLPDNTVIGAMSLVNKIFAEAGTVIAGVPAKVLRTGVNRDWRNIDEYLSEVRPD